MVDKKGPACGFKPALGDCRTTVAPVSYLLAGVTEMSECTYKESFKVAGAQLLDAVKKLVHEGSVRRIIIKQEGRTVAEFPMTVGVVGAVFAPVLAAVGALAAVLTECTIEVERAAADDIKADVA